MRGRGSFAVRGRARGTRPDPGTGEPGPAKVFKQYYSGTFAARPVYRRRFSTSPFFPRFSPYPSYSLSPNRRSPGTGSRRGFGPRRYPSVYTRTTVWSLPPDRRPKPFGGFGNVKNIQGGKNQIPAVLTDGHERLRRRIQYIAQLRK